MAVNDQFFNIGNNPNLDAADTGVDPATGKILTPTERRNIFKSRILSKQNRQAIARNTAMSFGAGALVVTSKGNVDKRVQADGGALVAPVNSLTKRVDTLESTVANMQSILSNIRKVILKGNEVDQKIQEELAKQQNLFFQNRIKENREAELEESDLEEKAKPEIDKQQKKTFGFFDGITKALKILFGGFIAMKAFQLFNAWKDGNMDLFKQLGIDLNSALQQVTTGVFYFQKIVGNLVKLAGNFARSIGKLITKVITFPFKIAGKVIKGAMSKVFSALKKALPGPLKKALKLLGLGKNKVGKEVTKKVASNVAGKVAKKGILGSIPIIGTGLDIWGAVSEGMKGNWVGAGLYTAGAITSLIPGMQGVSGVLSVSAMGQSIHSDLKRDANKEGINIEGTDGVEINGMGNDNYNNLGAIKKRPPVVQVVNANDGKNGGPTIKKNAENISPNIASSNPDNLYDSHSKNIYNAYVV